MIGRNSEGVATGFPITEPQTQLFQSWVIDGWMLVPRVAKAQPWAGISERFQRLVIPVLKLSIELAIPTFRWLISPLQPNAARRVN